MLYLCSVKSKIVRLWVICFHPTSLLSERKKAIVCMSSSASLRKSCRIVVFLFTNILRNVVARRWTRIPNLFNLLVPTSPTTTPISINIVSIVIRSIREIRTEFWDNFWQFLTYQLHCNLRPFRSDSIRPHCSCCLLLAVVDLPTPL